MLLTLKLVTLMLPTLMLITQMLLSLMLLTLMPLTLILLTLVLLTRILLTLTLLILTLLILLLLIQTDSLLYSFLRELSNYCGLQDKGTSQTDDSINFNVIAHQTIQLKLINFFLFP